MDSYKSFYCIFINITQVCNLFKRPRAPQNQESLDPNNLEFWMDGVYTPGYEALLRRKEADLRRAKFCKLAALIAATVVIILIIVVPLCTMGL